MKKISNKRLTLDRETVRALVVELSGDQLRYVNGAAGTNTIINTNAATACYPCNSSQLRCGCCSSVIYTTLIG